MRMQVLQPPMQNWVTIQMPINIKNFLAVLPTRLAIRSLADKLTSLQSNFEIQTRQNQINLLTKDKATAGSRSEKPENPEGVYIGSAGSYFLYCICYISKLPQ